MDPMTRSFVAGMERFAKQEQIPVVQFRKGQRKDNVMAEHLARFDNPEGIVMLGKAQEKTPVFRTQKRRNPQTGKEIKIAAVTELDLQVGEEGAVTVGGEAHASGRRRARGEHRVDDGIGRIAPAAELADKGAGLRIVLPLFCFE